MKLTVDKIVVPPAGKIYAKGGWSRVFVHFTDKEFEVYPSVTVETHVPCKLTDTYEMTREHALERAKVLLKATLEALEKSELASIDFAPV